MNLFNSNIFPRRTPNPGIAIHQRQRFQSNHIFKQKEGMINVSICPDGRRDEMHLQKKNTNFGSSMISVFLARAQVARASVYFYFLLFFHNLSKCHNAQACWGILYVYLGLKKTKFKVYFLDYFFDICPAVSSIHRG